MIRKYLNLYFCVITLLFTSVTQSLAQQVFKTTPTSVIGYLEYLPSDYNSNSNKYPVVIFLHGLGERGPNSTDPNVLDDGVNLLTRLGPPKYVKYGTAFPFILISPQLKSSYGNWPSEYVMEVINHVKTYLRIDERRIYLTGLSLGGGGTWWTAQDYAKEFAAIAPVCGSRNSPSKASLLAAEDLPVWGFHGDQDAIVPLWRSQVMINSINGCSPIPSPRAKLSIYPGVKHNAWDNAYKTDHSVHNPNVYEWMLSFTNIKNGNNKIPVATACTDIVKTLPDNRTTLKATAVDYDGSIVSYSWKKIKGPSSGTLSSATGSTVTASNLVAGVYIFRVRATDNSGNTDSDYVKVTVKSSTSTSTLMASAGPDQSITLPTNSITITGSVTEQEGDNEDDDGDDDDDDGDDSDTDNTISYLWTKVSGGKAVISGETTTKLVLSGMEHGSYVFRFAAQDNKGRSHADEVTILVKPSASNTPPVVDAGPDKTVTSGSVTLQANVKDGDGKITSYSWTKVSGGSAKLKGDKTAKLSVSGMKKGSSYVFRLTAKDDKGALQSDDVTVTFKSDSDEPPVVDAGNDRVVRLPVTSVTIVGEGKSRGGKIASYQWTQISGPPSTLTNSTSARLKVANVSSGTRVYRLKVTDENGKTSADDVTVKFNYPPVSDAGADMSVKLPKSSVVLHGSGSDKDGTITYQWSRVSGPLASIANSGNKALSVSDLTSGVYVFKLAVTDNIGIQSIDYVTVRVLPENSSASGRIAAQETGEATESSAPEETSLDDPAAQQKFDLSDKNTQALKDYTVTVFTGRGERIYAGQWEGDSYQLVFSKSGLYIYNVLQDSKIVDSGKIYIRD
jgi:dienelactone hydrolase